MEIYGDYHTHTVYSHGKGSIRENVEAAINKGLREIAITDHGSGHMLYGVKRENFKKMREEIDLLNEEYYKDIKVFLGVEANIVSINGDIDVDYKLNNMIDLLLVGFHYGAKPKTLKDAYNMYVLSKFNFGSKKKIEKSRELNTRAMVNAINNYKIDFITHPGAKLDIDVIEVARVAERRGTALEINAHHGHLSVSELREIRNENVKFVINSDAHRPEDVGNVQKAIDRAVEVGLDKKQIINIE